MFVKTCAGLTLVDKLNGQSKLLNLNHVAECEGRRLVATRQRSRAYPAHVQAAPRRCQEDGGQCPGGAEEEWEGEQVCAQACYPARKGDGETGQWYNEGGGHGDPGI